MPNLGKQLITAATSDRVHKVFDYKKKNLGNSIQNYSNTQIFNRIIEKVIFIVLLRESCGENTNYIVHIATQN